MIAPVSRILITGATGFVGAALRRVLAPRHRLVLAQRRAGGAAPDGEIRIVGDIGPRTDWSAALRDVEQVVHLAAHVHVTAADADPMPFMRVNCEGTRRLAEAAARAGIGRFVFLSSVKVHGDSSGDGVFRESDAPHPADPYGRSKWEAEQALAALAAADRLLASLAVDDARFRADYAWRPPYTVDEGLALTARWFRDAPER
jgi:nucleoside-diphosphate-sugar epimerase